MSLDPRTRKSLMARANRLRPLAVIGADPPSEAVLAHVRALLAAHRLVKVRIQTDDRAVCDAVSADLARLAPCDLVARIGRIALLHRATDGEPADAE